MSLAKLAAFAVSNNNTRTSSGVHLLSLKDARAKVTIQDGNRKAKEDGSQALTLTLGKYVISLDAVAPKATRVNAVKGKVKEFTALLQAALDAGDFDQAIVAAQAKADPANRPAKPTPSVAPAGQEEAPESVDLDELG